MVAAFEGADADARTSAAALCVAGVLAGSDAGSWLEPLRAALSCEDVEVRRLVAEGLADAAGSGVGLGGCGALLTERLAESDDRTRRAVARTLAAVGTSLEGPEVDAALVDSDAVVRATMVRAVARYAAAGGAVDRWLRVLVNHLADGSGTVRAAALHALDDCVRADPARAAEVARLNAAGS